MEQPASDGISLAWAVERLLACPACGRSVMLDEAACRCSGCGRRFPIEEGVPDFVLGALPAALALEDEWYAPSRVSAAPLPDRHHVAHAAARRPLTEQLRGLGCDGGSTVLSVATGNGVEIPYLSAVTQRIVGTDISTAALRQFRRRWPFLAVRAEAGRLPFFEGAFDAVVACALLHHVAGYADLRTYLREFTRVTRPGGAVVAVEPNAWYPVQWALWPVNRIMQRIWPRWRGLVPHERPLSPRFLVRQFMRAGLSDVGYVATTFTHNRFPTWASHWLEPRESPVRTRWPFRAFGWWVLVWGRRPAEAATRR